ncbi:MAG: hypothetical protein KDE50_09355, partial [Caldilineaceae bacterium]|nr:hypothetical protein [Caldilineaceae bacterium]
MNELTHLHALLNCVYGLEPVTLTPLHLFAHTDRGFIAWTRLTGPRLCCARRNKPKPVWMGWPAAPP